MSMNLHLSGEREVTVNKTGKTSTQTVYFDLWQTPTVVTRAAIASGDPKSFDIAWIMERSKDENELVYADDDLFCDREPVGTKVVNVGKDHIKELEEFLTMCEEEGYTVEFFEM